jgi:hypothetical protein
VTWDAAELVEAEAPGPDVSGFIES